jgi:DNA-binding NarL/FixJ family response regulator
VIIWRPSRLSYILPLPGVDRDVLRRLAEGSDVLAIAMDVRISVNTCPGYMKSLLMSCVAYTHLEAVVIATEPGLVPV